MAVGVVALALHPVEGSYHETKIDPLLKPQQHPHDAPCLDPETVALTGLNQ